MNGIAATVSGVLSTAAALALIAVKDEASVQVVAWIVLGASALWMVGAAMYGRIDEPAGKPDDEPISQDLLGRLRLLREDALLSRRRPRKRVS